MLTPFRFGLGGRLSSGRQWMPWIHIDDLVEALLWMATSTDLAGPVNAAAPGEVTNLEFTKTLGRVLKRPTIFPVPRFMLRLLICQFAEILEVYGDNRGVVLSYPTGFSRGILSTLTVKGVDENGRAFTTHPEIEWENPFRRELTHFHRCITDGDKCRTPVVDARQDVALIIDIVQRYLAAR